MLTLADDSCGPAGPVGEFDGLFNVGVLFDGLEVTGVSVLGVDVVGIVGESDINGAPVGIPVGDSGNVPDGLNEGLAVGFRDGELVDGDKLGDLEGTFVGVEADASALQARKTR